MRVSALWTSLLRGAVRAEPIAFWDLVKGRFEAIDVEPLLAVAYEHVLFVVGALAY